MLKITCAAQMAVKNTVIAVLVPEGGRLAAVAQKLDQKMAGALRRAIKAAPTFEGKIGQSLSVMTAGKGATLRLVLVGAGKSEKLDALAYEMLGGRAYASLAKETDGEGAILVDVPKGAKTGEGDAAAALGLGASLASYHFDKYHTKKKDKTKKLKGLTLVVADVPVAKKMVTEAQKAVMGVCLARDLVSEPANHLDPAALAQAASALKELGVEIEVLSRAQMEKLGMGAILSVAQGSEKPPFMVAMNWKGDPQAKDRRPLALVGKGVTFDTGGISLKPPAGMGDMKYDMAGAAAVIGTMKTLALRKAKANVVGLVGLVENMPSGHATRPGDVVKSASGQTIEITNTDAEGRMVLADTLWYAQHKYKPRAIIDLATLTGAMSIALGMRYAGLFSNDDAFAEKLLAASKTVEEPLWRMPMHESFDKQIDSVIADMRDVSGTRHGGSIIGAQFLQRFINKGTPWAHLDIAPKAWEEKGTPLCPKGATGFGVRLLDALVGAEYKA